MAKYISLDAVVAEIERRRSIAAGWDTSSNGINDTEFELWNDFLSFLDTLEVEDPYEQRIQYASIKDGIKAHAETYSFNIESELFNQLTKEQQKLWRKEIEQACISGGEVGVELARDIRYKENVEMKKVDFKKEINKYISYNFSGSETMGFFANRTKEEPNDIDMVLCAKHFFELGVNASNPLTWEDIKLIWTIGDEIPYMPEEDFFKELLNRFKARKGE